MIFHAAVLLGALAAAADEAPQPRLYVEIPEIDFGTIFEGELKSRMYHLENRGGAPLVFDRIKPTCGCAAARIFVGDPRTEIGLDKQALIGGKTIFVLPPGESADLQVDYDATGQPPIAMVKKVLLGTNDPEQKAFSLVMKVKVEHGIRIHPRQVRFDDVLRGRGATQDVLIQISPGLDLSIVSVGNTNEIFGATVEPIPNEGDERRYRVRVTLAPEAAVGPQSRTLTLETDHPNLKRKNLPIIANVRSAVRFDTGNRTHESTLSFGVIPHDATGERVIEIRNGDPSVPYTVLGVDVDSRWKTHIDVEVRESEPGRSYQLVVTTKPGLDVRFFRGTLTIRAEHPDEPTKMVQFNGQFAPAPKRG